MRWMVCALLLLSPAIAWADAPTLSVSPTDSTDPDANARGEPFFNQVRATVTRAAGSGGTISVTLKVNDSVPLDVPVDPPPDPNNPPPPGATRTFTHRGLPLANSDPWTLNNTTFTVTATDSDDPTHTATVTVTGTFDDIKPVAEIEIYGAPVVDGKTGFASLRVRGTMSDNDPNFTGLIQLGSFSQIFAIPDKANFDQRIPLNPGLNNFSARPTDNAGNFPDPNDPALKFSITRTIVCQDPNFPIVADPDPNDPNQPVTRKTYTVDRFDDLPDPILDDDVCDVRPDLKPGGFVPPGIGRCTLRAAIQTANHHPGDDTISLGGGVIVLRRQGVAEDTEKDASGDLDVTGNLRIVGQSRDSSIIDARKLGDRVFDVADGARLQLLRLTVSGGRTPKPRKPDPAESGGCVRSRGTLHANNVAFLDCKSEGAGGAVAIEPSTDPNAAATLTCVIAARSQAKTDGGALAVDSVPLVLRNSTLSLNSANSRGGGLSAVSEGPLAIAMSNVTMSHNKAKLAGGSLDLGDGVTAKLNNCTFTNNSAKLGVTLSTMDGGEAEISNSILGDGKRACDPTAAQTVVSKGGNVERLDTCLTSPALTDQQNVDPKLDKLATNFGPPTHALKLGSPALDQAGTGDVPCEPLDARGAERGDWPLAEPNRQEGEEIDLSAFCDAGAFERAVTPLP